MAYLLYRRVRLIELAFLVLLSPIVACFSGCASPSLQIESQTASQTVLAGQNATFQVIANGSGALHYQWFAGGAAIAGASESSYTVSQVTTAQSGTTYTVKVTDDRQSVMSTPAALTVTPLSSDLQIDPVAAQVFGAPPFALKTTSSSNSVVTFSVVSGPAVITGSTVAWTGAGTVVVSASQAANGDYGPGSATASVVVAPAVPGLSFTPITQKIYGTAPFEVSATSVSSGPVTYGVASGPAKVSGSTVTLTGFGTVVLSATQVANGNYAQATASTSFSVGSSIRLSAISPAAVTTGPGVQRFATVATGGSTNGIVWTASGGTIDSTGRWTSPSAAGTYVITATSAEDPTKFVTAGATVSAPVIIRQPAGQSVCPSSSVSLSVVAQYADSYQWYLNGAAISGATGATYVAPMMAQGSVGTYAVVISNSAGTVVSGVANVAVGSAFTTSPKGASLVQPASATFSLVVQGQSPFNYQWYSIAPQATAGTAIQGATSASYTIPHTSFAANGTAFYALVVDGCGTSLQSSSATLTVNSAPVITQQPANQTVSPGTSAYLSVAASGTPTFGYHWYWKPAGLTRGISIAGANTASYTIPATATRLGNSGDAYFVAISNAFGTADSQPATLQTGLGTNAQWVVGWGASPENSVTSGQNSGGQEQSFRSFFYPTVSGSVERVHLSNLFGATPITIGAARIAAAASSNGVGGKAIDAAQDVALTFQGSPTVILQPGQEVVSDPVQITYSLGEKLAVSLYVQGAFPALTQHESQVNVNYATPIGAGDATGDASGASFSQSNTEWYLLTGVDVYGQYQGTVAVFGSSSVDGHASNFGDTNAYPVFNVAVPGQDNDRPSDWLGRELAMANYHVGVLNAGTIGDPAGEDARSASGAVIAGVDRMQHDVLEQPGIKAVVIYFGGIDLRGDCKAATDVEVSLSNMVAQAHAAGVRVILGTLPPSEYCLSAQPLPSAGAPYAGDINSGTENPGSTQRRLLNDWIRMTGSTLPGVVAIADFDQVLADPQHPDFMLPNLNSGDNFHPNGTGYGVQSSAIPLSSLLGP